MKYLYISILFLLLIVLFGCSEQVDDEAPGLSEAVVPDISLPVFTDIDFTSSPFKHINNGGIDKPGSLPYNIDAITGATVTVEGAGVRASTPLSMREIQNTDDGLVRAVYEDSNGAFVYEGLDLFHLLNNMTRGDKGIHLTDNAYSARLMDENRVLIADIPLADIEAARNSGKPLILAYGIGTLDMSIIAPFVFDGANPDAHSEGYIPELGNEGGCLKLVFAPDDNTPYSGTFPSIAYIYVAEETEPGFKHTTSADPVYSSGRFTDYIITFRGDALGAEMVFTVSELENLAQTDAEGYIAPNGLGYRDYYSLANNAYWYVNEYEGLDLYKLLLYLGMDSAEQMGRADARTTLISFVADDGFISPESFSVEILSYPEAFGFYRKNAIDMDDGAYIPTSADLEKSGYPVLLAYGVNGYPYTITTFDDGFLSGLSNDGGPMRVVFGKTQYHHANGSYQVKFLRDVIAGNDVLYNTHKYTDNPHQRAYTDDELTITVNGEDGSLLTQSVITVGEIEDILYGTDVNNYIKRAAGVKDHYQIHGKQGIESSIFEGISLEYFLMEHIGLPGTSGTATFFSDNGESVSVNLDTLFKSGYNTQLERDGIIPALAFSKNGSPMVPDDTSPGYVQSLPLHPVSEHEPAMYHVGNSGGPLAVLIPAPGLSANNIISIPQVAKIEINLVPDAYAHITAPYSAYAGDVIRLYGDGLEREGEVSVADIISRQRTAKTLDYSYLSGDELSMQRFRGIPVFDLFIEFGIMANAGDVLIHDAGGNVHQFTLSSLRRRDYQNHASPGKEPLFAMIAFGTGIAGEDTMRGLPLVPAETDTGYDGEIFNNAGGPLMLVVPQDSHDSDNYPLWVQRVIAIEVTANETDSWGHAMSDIYTDFLDDLFTLTVRNDDSEWSHVFTVAELEEMTEIIVRDTYSVLDIGECEGVDIWRLIRRIAGDVPGIENPVSVTAFASDGYMNDLLSVFGMDAFELGVPDGEGNRKPLIIAYAVNGLPLVDTESHVGYTGLANNSGGPLRIVAETNQGASVKYVTGITVVIPGSGDIGYYSGN